jgi:hypothetical protein
MDRRRKGEALPRLTSDEGASVLRSLLDRHPELVEEAEEIARAWIADVDGGAVADEVEQAVLDLEADELSGRAGRTREGYVEPTEAAWELLREALEPFLEEMKRHVAAALRDRLHGVVDRRLPRPDLLCPRARIPSGACVQRRRSSRPARARGTFGSATSLAWSSAWASGSPVCGPGPDRPV